jgi:sulfite exporter TauE/SafE
MIDGVGLAAALGLGAMSSAHCVGMCGGIGASLGLAGEGRRWTFVGCYNLGRIGVYAMLGALAGAAAAAAGATLQPVLPQVVPWLRTLAGLLVIAMGLYIGGWWLGLRHLETAGAALWRRVRPLTQRWLPPRTPGAALALGAAWGLLPCGLVYSSLAWAALRADPLQGAALMAAFGLGTLPSMIAVAACGNALGRHLRRPAVRRVAGALLLLLGVATSALPWRHAGAEGHRHNAAAVAPTGAAPALSCH